jgi:uncharacterized lipoprotein YmbA
MRTVLTFVAIALMAGCASTDQSAEEQCRYFVRDEGFEWVRNIESKPAAAGGTAITMEVKDGLARSFKPTCIYADGKKRWAEPLPSNVVRDYFGRSKS